MRRWKLPAGNIKDDDIFYEEVCFFVHFFCIFHYISLNNCVSYCYPVIELARFSMLVADSVELELSYWVGIANDIKQGVKIVPQVDLIHGRSTLTASFSEIRRNVSQRRGKDSACISENSSKKRKRSMLVVNLHL